MIKRNIWIKINSKESAYASFFSFIRIVIVVIIATGSGIILSFILNKMSPIIDKVGIDSRIIGLVVLVILLGILTMALILLLRLNELAAAAVIAINIVIDLYLALYFVSLIMALAMLLIFFLARSPRHPWVAPRALWLWALFLVLAIFPVAQTIIPFDGITYYLKVFFTGFIMYCLGTMIARNSINIRYLFRWLAIFGAFDALVTIIQSITGVIPFSSSRSGIVLQAQSYYLSGTGTSRAGAFLINPDPNSCFLAMMLLIALGLLLDAPRLQIKVFYLSVSLLISLALLSTYSTEGLLGALAGVTALIALAGNARSRIFLLLLLLGMITTAIVGLPTQVSLLLQHASNPGELSLRSGAWQTGIRVIQAFPLTGVGLGSYVYRVRAEPYRVPAQYIVLDHPHNSYLEIAALAGLPVLIIFMALLIFALSLAFDNWLRVDKRDRTLLGTGVAIVIVLSFVSLSDGMWTFFPLSTIGWLVLGVTSSPLLTKSRKMLGNIQEEE